jgi:hypothetical protein
VVADLREAAFGKDLADLLDADREVGHAEAGVLDLEVLEADARRFVERPAIAAGEKLPETTTRVPRLRSQPLKGSPWPRTWASLPARSALSTRFHPLPRFLPRFS